MSFSKNDLETIKSKIKLSSEIGKKIKIIKKGNDHWCCCPFHDEKTPSCKINDDLGSFYCFGCGAKGDIFTIYTDLYNFSFPDAVKELGQRIGIKITDNNFKLDKKSEKYFEILECATDWFEKNLQLNDDCIKYLKKRSISNQTISEFRIGYSDNPKFKIYEYLKTKNFSEDEIVESNLVKRDNNNKIKDFFYKRLIFPISNERGKVVGFGGRVLDNSMPKYINSPESIFFKKRDILYNLHSARNSIRQKKNMLICEGYMDVISLYDKNIKTAVAPLGTALTENQLLLSWKYVNKPTIMFDGDNSGLKASLKAALISLPLLSTNKYLQFIKLPNNFDPDSFIKVYSIRHLINLLKNPISIVEFIFDRSSEAIDLTKADNKIQYDKYLDDITSNIKDNKIKYFYKNEFKNLFFNKLKNLNKKNIKFTPKEQINSLIEMQIFSFLATYLNHVSVREELGKLIKNSQLLDQEKLDFLNYFENSDLKSADIEILIKSNLPEQIRETLKNSMENRIFTLFPYAQKQYNSLDALEEVQESVKNLNTRLLNLKKINKSLNKMTDNTSKLNWDELKKISSDLYIDTEDKI